MANISPTLRTSSASAPLLDCVAALNAHELRHFSISKLIKLEAERAARAMGGRSDMDIGRRLTMTAHGFREAAEPAQARAEAPESVMHELSREIEKEVSRAGISGHGGVFIPTRLRAAGLDTKSNSAGAYFVGADVRDFVDVLAEETTVVRLGGQIISGLRGNASWPREISAPVSTWVAENPTSDVAENDASFTSTAVVPKMLTSTTSYSRKLLAESAPGIDSWIKRRLARANGIALDQAAISGTGTLQPTGLLNTSGVGLYEMGPNGATITVSALIAMEKTLSDANAVAGGLLTTTGIRSVLRGLPAIANGSVPLWDNDNMVLGYKGEVSTRMPSNGSKGNASPPRLGLHSLVLGDWSNLVIAEWGALEILVDVYTQKKAAMVQVTAYAMHDIAVIRPSAFCICTDALTS